MRIKLTVSYDGTEFCGWQVQPNGISVQQTLEEGIEKVSGERVIITGSGRTDAGVHAVGQVAHFDTQSSIPADRWAKALNTVLPPSVKVLDSGEIDCDFNARKSAKKKTYKYSFYKANTELPLKERFAVKLEKPVDIKLMNRAAEIFVGEHDFKCFNASGGGAKSTVRKIFAINIKDSAEDLIVSVSGNGFLYKMVRSLVGVLISVGEGKTTLADCENMLLSGKKGVKAKTLPAKGLCLFSVEYGN